MLDKVLLAREPVVADGALMLFFLLMVSFYVPLQIELGTISFITSRLHARVKSTDEHIRIHINYSIRLMRYTKIHYELNDLFKDTRVRKKK